MRRIPLVLVALLLACAALSQPVLAQRRVALVVGNGRYRHAPPLANPVNDARLMAEALKAIGFELVGGKALTDLPAKADMEQAVRRFGEMIRGGGVGLFYYAGHGLQVEGRNYLVPVGADVATRTQIKYELVDADYVLDEMSGSSTSVNIIILDACRNNPFADRGFRSVAPGLATVTAPRGTLVAYSTAPGRTAADGRGRNSPFTEALARAIGAPGLRIEDVFIQVGLDVERATGGEQSPWKSDNLRGVFCLNGPCGQAVPAPPALQAAPSVHAAPAVPAVPPERPEKTPDGPRQTDRTGSCPQGFAGRWATSYGELELRFEGNRVVGSYDYGEVRGTISGGIITGEWIENRTLAGIFNGKGPLRWELAPDGMSFSGTWRRVAGFGNPSGTWTGTCKP